MKNLIILLTFLAFSLKGHSQVFKGEVIVQKKEKSTIEMNGEFIITITDSSITINHLDTYKVKILNQSESKIYNQIIPDFSEKILENIAFWVKTNNSYFAICSTGLHFKYKEEVYFFEFLKNTN